MESMEYPGESCHLWNKVLWSGRYPLIHTFRDFLQAGKHLSQFLLTICKLTTATEINSEKRHDWIYDLRTDVQLDKINLERNLHQKYAHAQINMENINSMSDFELVAD